MEKKWAMWLVLVGGVLWGLVGLGYFVGSNLNILNLVLGGTPTIENLVYLVVGLCALWWAYLEVK